jgi:hypothetical protein
MAILAAATALCGFGPAEAAEPRRHAAPKQASPPALPPGAPTATQAALPDQDKDTPVTEEIQIAGRVFRLEVAADDAGREQGLMDRNSIEPDRGMLFIHPEEDRRSFWMANCRCDMDLIFLDRLGRIVALHKMKKEPPRGAHEGQASYERRLKRYSSRRPAQFAIELRAGSIDDLKLKEGDRIDLPAARLIGAAR